MTPRWRLTGVFVLLLMALGGCSWPLFAAATPPPAPTALPPTATPTALPAPTATPTLAVTPTPPPTATAIPGGALLPCVPPNPAATLPPDLNFKAALGGTVQQALNAGMPIANLNNALQRAQLGGYPYAAVSGDFDGDHYEDAAVTLVNTSCGKHPPQGVLLVFVCREGRFADPAVFQEPTTGLAWGAPTIQFAQDLNADGRTELVVSAAHCDAQGMVCEERYAILAWRDGGLRDLLEGGEGPFASPVPFVEDPDGDGIYDFIVETGSGERLVWHYQGGAWKR